MLMYSCFSSNVMEVSRMGSNLEGLPEVPEHPTWGCHGDNGSCWYGLWSKVDLARVEDESESKKAGWGVVTTKSKGQRFKAKVLKFNCCTSILFSTNAKKWWNMSHHPGPEEKEPEVLPWSKPKLQLQRETSTKNPPKAAELPPVRAGPWKVSWCPGSWCAFFGGL